MTSSEHVVIITGTGYTEATVPRRIRQNVDETCHAEYNVDYLGGHYVRTTRQPDRSIEHGTNQW